MAKILIVDDEYLTVEMLSTFLGLIGHETEGAHSVRQAKDKLAYINPDVVLLDIMLPDNNGLDLCKELRADPITAGLPVVMISAHAPPMTSEATQAGANGYLVKPINFDKLKGMLTQIGIA
jgi:DNA-binding response OmpR family regulator